MKPHPAQPLPAALESAVQRLKRAARDAAQRTVESLGLAALSALSAHQREQLLAAQFELNRKLAPFAVAFNDALDEQLIRELGRRVDLELPPSTQSAKAADSMWDSLRLVDDGEVEAQISADRFAMDVAHSCEWELREIDAYLGSVLPESAVPLQRSPLRPDLIGRALVKAIQVLSDRAEVRKVLLAELGRSLIGLLRGSYASIVADWRQAGLRPASLAVRRRLQREGGPDETNAEPGASRRGGLGAGPLDVRAGGTSPTSAGARAEGPASRNARLSGFSNFSGFGEGGSVHPQASTGRTALRNRPNGSSADSGPNGPYGPYGPASQLGQVDPGLMSLIRRLAYSTPAALNANPAGANPEGAQGAATTSRSPRRPEQEGAAPAGWAVPDNLIHAHREELRQASSGALDHMVIDVIGFLFDQILSDPKVPPQMARLLARLQLPVLRAALGDAAFFASRKHPVRRFVNRMATLSAAYDDVASAEAQAFLAKASELVHEVVEGDFEQITLFEDKLAALEAFVAQQQAELLHSEGSDAAALVAQKEDEQRLQQLYAERLAGDLRSVSAPVFVLDFLSSVWSQVLMRAQTLDARSTPPGKLADNLRPVARELVLSVQPKVTPAQRKALLSELPRLMRALTEGMDLVTWPHDNRRQFFGQLMPAHAEALKATTARQLDINMTLRQVDGALSRPPPSRADLAPGFVVPVLRDVLVPSQFSAEEAQRIGLVDEASVQWDGQIDIDVGEIQADATQAGNRRGGDAQLDSGESESAAGAPVLLPGMPEMATDAEVLTAREMADQVQIGFAYQMHLDGDWHKVRLSHVSAGRNFFIFTRGARHCKTMSMTHRMLVRLCEAERFRAIETSSLLERATARARKQLAELAAAARPGEPWKAGRVH